MDRRGKVGVAFRYWFNVRTGSGAPRTGLVAGDFAVTVRNPADSAESTPAVAESATTGGLYYFDVPGAFTTTNGVGEYGVTIAVTTAPLDVGGGSVLFEAVTLDDLAVAGDEMNLADDAITSAKYDESTAFPIAQADAGASGVARTGADGDDLKDISDEIASVQADTDDIQSRLPAALIGGRMDSDVGAIQVAALAAINTYLAVTAAHGTGAWDGTQADWSAVEREQIRFRLAMDGTQTDPTTNIGTIEDILANIGAPIALDGGVATIAGMLTKLADDNNGADFVASTDSLNKIAIAIAAIPTSTGMTVGEFIALFEALK